MTVQLMAPPAPEKLAPASWCAAPAEKCAAPAGQCAAPAGQCAAPAGQAHPAPPKRVTLIAVAQRYGAVALVAIVVGALHISHRPATLCPFRALTGLPCPLCGGTTAAVHLGHGDVRGALAASPLAVGLLATWPLIGAVKPPKWWQSRRARWLVITTVLISSEIWQLVRFGIIHI